jgi:hypothetical protein
MIYLEAFRYKELAESMDAEIERALKTDGLIDMTTMGRSRLLRVAPGNYGADGKTGPAHTLEIR